MLQSFCTKWNLFRYTIDSQCQSDIQLPFFLHYIYSHPHLFPWNVVLQDTTDNDRNRNCESNITSYRWELQRITDEFWKQFRNLDRPTDQFAVCAITDNRGILCTLCIVAQNFTVNLLSSCGLFQSEKPRIAMHLSKNCGPQIVWKYSAF